MSSDGMQRPENGCSPTDNLKTQKTLKSLVIPDNDPLKIKLKISKRDIEEPVSNRKDISVEYKGAKTHRNSVPGQLEIKNGEESSKAEMVAAEEKLLKINNIGEPKMKLRSKKETESETEFKKDENEEPAEEKKKRKESWYDKDLERPKKRGKMSKTTGDENSDKGEEIVRRRTRRNEDAIVSEKPMEIIEVSFTASKVKVSNHL